MPKTNATKFETPGVIFKNTPSSHSCTHLCGTRNLRFWNLIVGWKLRVVYSVIGNNRCNDDPSFIAHVCLERLMAAACKTFANDERFASRCTLLRVHASYCPWQCSL